MTAFTKEERARMHACAPLLGEPAATELRRLLDALEVAEARAERAEAEAAAMRKGLEKEAISFDGQGVDCHICRYTESDRNEQRHRSIPEVPHEPRCPLHPDAGKALLAEMTRLRARLAEVEREKEDVLSAGMVLVEEREAARDQVRVLVEALESIDSETQVLVANADAVHAKIARIQSTARAALAKVKSDGPETDAGRAALAAEKGAKGDT